MKPKRDESGRLPAYAWPGGYAIVYYAKDCSELCHECANGENGSLAHEDKRIAPDDQWLIAEADIYWEGPDLYCSNCAAPIPSEYGDQEE